MYNEFMEDKLRLWQVQLRRKGHGLYVDSLSINVTAKTIEEALEKVRGEYPGGKILSINHKGHIDL